MEKIVVLRGRDPLGSHDMKKGGSGSPKYGKVC